MLNTKNVCEVIPPSLVTDVGGERGESSDKRGTLVRKARGKKGTIGAHVKLNHIVFTYYPKHPDCNVCKMKIETLHLQKKGFQTCGWDRAFRKNFGV